MPTPISDQARRKLVARLKQDAAALGFDACHVTDATLPAEVGNRLEDAIAKGHHASMDWLAETAARRKSPDAMWDQARSAILLGMNYGPDTDPLVTLGRADRATISVYARNRDYHDIVKGKLKTLASKFVASARALHGAPEVKVFVDTAPLMEKPLATQAGLGWQGKHTNMVSREHGSWLFLGAILTDMKLPADAPEVDHCGSCRACLDICPTNAFPAPYQLDANRCISYLTIEHHGPIPHEFRKAMGNRIYGCDDCLAVCPWNKFASTAREAKLQAREDLKAPVLADLLQLDDAGFRALFSGSPIKRIGRNRFVRNCLIAAGNSGLKSLSASIIPHLQDGDAAVRGTAIWALSQVDFAALQQISYNILNEPDNSVLREWELAGIVA